MALLRDLAGIAAISTLCSTVVLQIGSRTNESGERAPRSADAADTAASGRTASPTGASVTEAALKHDVAVLQAELANLRAELHGQRRQTAATDRGNHPQAEAASVADARMNEALEESQQVQAERIQSLEAAVAAEQLDAEWSDRSGELIRTVLRQRGFQNADLYNVDCRSTLCRVEIGVQNIDAIQELGIKLPLAVGAALPGMTMQQIEHEDGSATAVLFLSREGYDFPS